MLSEAFAAAVQHHQAGRLQAAEQLYRQILQVEPDHAGVLHLLGVVNAQLGKHQAGADYIRRAIALAPNWPDAHYNLGVALANRPGNMPEALQHLETALKLRPDPELRTLVEQLRRER